MSTPTVSPRIRLRVSAPAPPVTGLPNGPAWASALTVGEWFPFTTNLLRDVDPEDDPTLNPGGGSAAWHGASGQAGILNLWNGGAAVTPGTYDVYGGVCLAGGNHNGYHGSEVYYVDVGARVFRRLTDPYPTPDSGAYSSSYPYYPHGEYPDGSAVPSHEYTQLLYHPGSKAFWKMRSAAQLYHPTGTGGAYTPHRLKLDTLAWSRGAPALTGAGAIRSYSISGSKSCYDSLRDCFWTLTGHTATGFSGYEVHRHYDLAVQNGDGSYGKCATHYIRQPGNNQMSVEYDAEDDLLVYYSWEDTPPVTRAVSCAALIAAGTTRVESTILTEDSAGPAGLTKRSGMGCAWSPGLRSLLFMNVTAGTGLYRLQKPTAGTPWQTTAWRWSNLTAATNTQSVPQAASESGALSSNGVYSRLRVLKYADMELVVAVTRRDLPAYAMRIT